MAISNFNNITILIFTMKLLYINSIIEYENKIQVICKYNLMPMLMDLRQYTLFVPYHKTNKEIELILK